MNAVWVIVVAMLGTSLSLPVNNLDGKALMQIFSSSDELGRNSALENLLIGVLEDLREIMVTGNDDIPVLDPFHLDHLLVDDSIIPLPGAYINIDNLRVSKLSTFELNTVEVSRVTVIRYNVIVDAEVPVIEVDVGKYDLSANVNGLSFFGAGDAKITIIKPRINAALSVGVRIRLGAIYVNLQTTRIEFSISDIQTAVTGLFHDPSVDSFVNAFLRNLVLELLEAYSELLTATVSPIVQDFANEILEDLNLIDLLG